MEKISASVMKKAVSLFLTCLLLFVPVGELVAGAATMGEDELTRLSEIAAAAYVPGAVYSSVAAKYNNTIIYSDYLREVSSDPVTGFDRHKITGSIKQRDLTSKKETVLSEAPTVQLAVYGSAIYYIVEGHDDGQGIYKLDLNSRQTVKLNTQGYVPHVWYDADSYVENVNFVIYNGELIFVGRRADASKEFSYDYAYIAINLDTGALRRISDAPMDPVSVMKRGKFLESQDWDTAEDIYYDLQGNRITVNQPSDMFTPDYCSEDYLVYNKWQQTQENGAVILNLHTGAYIDYPDRIGSVNIIDGTLFGTISEDYSNEKTIELSLSEIYSAAITPTQYLLFSELAYKNLKPYIGKDISEVAQKLYPENQSDSLFKNSTGSVQISAVLQQQLSGWTVETILEDSESGFYAAAFKYTQGDVRVIGIRGSQSIAKIDAMKTDWLDNAVYGLMNEASPQMYAAMQLIGTYLEKNNIDRSTISVTGHSLGGGLGDLIANLFNIKGETFDASPMIDVSYYQWNMAFCNTFAGIDKWTYLDHVNEYDPIGLYEFEIKNAVQHKSTLPSKFVTQSHQRNALIQIDQNGNVTMSDIVKVQNSQNMKPIYKAVTQHGAMSLLTAIDSQINPIRRLQLNQLMPKGSLVLGTSKNEALHGNTEGMGGLSNTIVVPHTDVIYGGDGNDTIRAESGDDYIIPGVGDDVIYGGTGNDQYMYYKGQGTDTIYDNSGNDAIHLLGYSESEIKKFSVDTGNKNYIKVKDPDGQTVLKIWRYSGFSTHSMDLKFYANGEEVNTTRLVDWNQVQKVRSIRVACPVRVEVYDETGALVVTLQDGVESYYEDDFGVFSVSYDSQTEEYIKYMDVFDDHYTFKIVGTGTGELSLGIQDEEPDGTIVGFTAEKVAATPQSTFSLATGSDADYHFMSNSQEIELTKTTYLPVQSISFEETEMNLKPQQEKSLAVTLTPENATQTAIEWTSSDESIATVSEQGVVTGVGEGTTFIAAQIDGKVAVCEVTVGNSSALADVLFWGIILFGVIYLAAAVILIIFLVKRRKKKKGKA